MTVGPQLHHLSHFDGRLLQIEKIYRKLYAACRHAHSAIEAAIELRNRYRINPAFISSIRIETYGMAIRGHDHIEIKGIQSAKMSIPFSVVLALKTGSAGLGDYNERNLEDEEIHRLMDMIRIVEDPEISSWLPRKRAARVTIVTTDNNSFMTCVEYPKGEPENPITESEIIEKNR